MLYISDSNGLWNSLSVLNDDSVIAVTSTKGLSSGNTIEAWMIKGYVMPEINADNTSVAIDGNENLWNTTLPFFIGHKGNTRLRANVFYDSENLYLVSKVTDANIVSQSSNTESNDGIVLYLDPKNRSLVAPGENIYKIFLSAGNNITIYKGNNKNWVKETESQGIISEVKAGDSGYTLELAIPWALLVGKTALNTRIGFNLELSEKEDNNYIDRISNNISYQSYTWSTLKLR